MYTKSRPYHIASQALITAIDIDGAGCISKWHQACRSYNSF